MTYDLEGSKPRIIGTNYQVQAIESKDSDWWCIGPQWPSLEIAREALRESYRPSHRWARFRVVKIETVQHIVDEDPPRKRRKEATK